MAKVETHYDILKVAPHAPISVIKAAYKSLCQTYHPDKFRGDATEGTKIFKAIQQSYAVLSDPNKKAEYDAWLAQSLKPSGKASQETSAATATKPVPAVSRSQQVTKIIVPTQRSQASTAVARAPVRRFLKLSHLRRVWLMLALIISVLVIQPQVFSGRWPQLQSIAPQWNLIKVRVLQLVNWEDSDKFLYATANHKTVTKASHRVLADKAKVKAIAYKKEPQAKAEYKNSNAERNAAISDQNPAIADKFADYYPANQPECDIAVILMDEHLVRCK